MQKPREKTRRHKRRKIPRMQTLQLRNPPRFNHTATGNM